MKTEAKFTYPDYKKIQEESHRINCTIIEEDFDTSRPNGRRIGYIVNDIREYLKHIHKEM